MAMIEDGADLAIVVGPMDGMAVNLETLIPGGMVGEMGAAFLTGRMIRKLDTLFLHHHQGA